jgi:hypothetical protein
MPITDLHLKITRNYQRLYCIYFFSLYTVYKSVHIFGQLARITTDLPPNAIKEISRES